MTTPYQDRSDASAEPPKKGPSAVVRLVLLATGWITTGLALAGAVLPVLPTTPFLLLAAACFVRSSPKLHQRLLQTRRLGPYLQQWEQDKSVPADAKLRAYVLVAVTFAISIYVVDSSPLRLVLAGLGLGVIALLVLLRTTKEPSDDAGDEDQGQRALSSANRSSSSSMRPDSSMNSMASLSSAKSSSRPSETARA